MCSLTVQPCCQGAHAHTWRSFWRRKWQGLTGFVFVVSIVCLVIRQIVHAPSMFENHVEHDTYMEKLLKSVHQDGVKWYNGQTLSQSSKDWGRYMSEIRRNWIVWAYNPNLPYNLENPEIEDQSMGQASEIRKILKNKKNGFFVECGAYDGETRSNTLVLERELGWTGLLVEADPMNFHLMLEKNRKAFLTPTCLGIQPYPTVSSFLMARNVGRLHEPNSTDAELPNSADVAHSGNHVLVQCFPFMHLMAALNVTTVDYFSLDVEGNELNVLKTIPFDLINIEALSVEFSHVEAGKEELIEFMRSKQYYDYSYVVRTDKLAHDIIFTKYGR